MFARDRSWPTPLPRFYREILTMIASTRACVLKLFNTAKHLSPVITNLFIFFSLAIFQAQSLEKCNLKRSNKICTQLPVRKTIFKLVFIIAIFWNHVESAFFPFDENINKLGSRQLYQATLHSWGRRLHRWRFHETKIGICRDYSRKLPTISKLRPSSNSLSR